MRGPERDRPSRRLGPDTGHLRLAPVRGRASDPGGRRNSRERRLLASLAIVGGYIGWRHAETGLTGLTSNGSWALYGRVAPFADCTGIHAALRHGGLMRPKAGRSARDAKAGQVTRTSTRPPRPRRSCSDRQFLISPDPDANEKLGAFARAAIRGQPGDYLDAVWQDLIRIVAPDHPSAGALWFNQFIPFICSTTTTETTTTISSSPGASSTTPATPTTGETSTSWRIGSA